MKNGLLRIYAATALDSILTADDVSYANLNRSALCFLIQERHAEIEKENTSGLVDKWNEIKDSDASSYFFFFLGPLGLDSLRTGAPLGKKS